VEEFSSETSSYLRKKFNQWKDSDGSVGKHVGLLGSRNKLAREFRKDFESELQPVCRDLKAMGYDPSREAIVRILGESLSSSLPFLGDADIILGGLIDACALRKRKGRIERW
jgi:transposase